ncbi:hypothetical protein FDK38_005352 [Candidozyma auris]|nr:hypothetical protein FDK38_005352 [[Candida] auris]
MNSFLWYRDQRHLRIGDVARYRIEYRAKDFNETEIFLRIKNLEKTPLRAIHLLNGPFILYSHVVPCKFDHKKPFRADDPLSNPEILFKNAIKPGQTFNVKLSLNGNSLKRVDNDGSKIYSWECDIISQIVLNKKATVLYDFMIGDNIHSMRRLNRSVLTSLTKGDMNMQFNNPRDDESTETLSISSNPNLMVNFKSTEDIWNLEPRDPNLPMHLVIVTHGLFSNLTADMLYLRDQLLSLDQNIVVSGYRGNAGRTEKGIHKLGVGVSFHVTNIIDSFKKSGMLIEKISFVAHSLGGPVQLYALKHILLVKGNDYFKRNNIQLEHFICLASPMLGIISEMSLWVSWFLDLGTLGKTGRDLTLSKKLPSIKHEKNDNKRDGFKPILETLPDEPVQSVLKAFKSRTVYANAFNDGIVPLRTSSLLYLDWAAMGDVSALRSHPEQLNDRTHRDNSSIGSTETNASGHDVGAVPYDSSSFEMSQRKSGKFTADNSFNEGIAESLTLDKLRQAKSVRRKKWYSKISAKGSETSLSDDEESDSPDNDEDASYYIPPKASAVESALSTLLCPVPSRSYINEPSKRSSVIFHDRFYHFNHIPQDTTPAVGTFKRLIRSREWKLEKQVKIARKYHSYGLNWRKVLVYLPPDAHNNIVVRRRFANGYGWGVIDHLLDQIFAEPKLTAKI